MSVGAPSIEDSQGSCGRRVASRRHWGPMPTLAAAFRAVRHLLLRHAPVASLATMIGCSICGPAWAADITTAATGTIKLPVRAAIAGVAPARMAGATGMGGTLIPADSAEAAADLKADRQFRSLFNTWKKLDTPPQGMISIPSVQPVDKLAFTSNFGIRTDPFRGTAAMHAGVDIPGPVGTPVYATADGVVDRAERAGGYGNLVEIDHGKGIATRYGHLSKILVDPGTHIHRGQLIALMGSTGRSTGPHLHYEVRIDGHAVNPAPFLTNADFLVAAQDRSVHAIPVSNEGPAPQD